MKKIIFQISLILLIIIIGMTSVFIDEVNAASIIKLNISEYKDAQGITNAKISYVLSGEAYSVQSNLVVEYSSGKKETIPFIYIPGMRENEKLIPASSDIPISVEAIDVIVCKKSGEFIEEDEKIDKQAIKLSVSSNQNSNTNTNKVNQNTTNQPSTTTNTTDKQNTTINTTPSTNINKPNTNTTTNTSTNENTNTNTNITNTNTTNTAKEPEIINPTFKEVKETVYASKGCNVRSSCSTKISSNKIGSLVKGQVVTRTGVDNTWSRIEFNGKTAYVATYLLTTEKPEEPENIVDENTITNNVIENEVAENNIVDSNIVNNEISDEQILNQIEQEIGVLPEVGHNIATNLFIIISVISLFVIMRLKYKSKE